MLRVACHSLLSQRSGFPIGLYTCNAWEHLTHNIAVTAYIELNTHYIRFCVVIIPFIFSTLSPMTDSAGKLCSLICWYCVVHFLYVDYYILITVGRVYWFTDSLDFFWLLSYICPIDYIVRYFEETAISEPCFCVLNIAAVKIFLLKSKIKKTKRTQLFSNLEVRTGHFRSQENERQE